MAAALGDSQPPRLEPFGQPAFEPQRQPAPLLERTARAQAAACITGGSAGLGRRG